MVKYFIRCGNFKRIYPNENVFYYKPFFESDRHFNKVLRSKFLFIFCFVIVKIDCIKIKEEFLNI